MSKKINANKVIAGEFAAVTVMCAAVAATWTAATVVWAKNTINAIKAC